MINPPPALPWLLEETDLGVRYLALRDLIGLSEADPELRSARQAAHRHGPIAAVLDAMHPDGYWVTPGPGYNPKYRSTVWALMLLAQLGAHIGEDERVDRACAYLLEHNLNPRGQFSTSTAPSGTVDCLQGNLTAALIELGCRDPRLEKAYEWLARTVTGEGLAPNTDRKAELRYYAAKCGPGFRCGANYGLPCAWGAVKVLLALGVCPGEWQTPLVREATQQAVEFLLSVDPSTAAYPSGVPDLPGVSGKPSNSWWKFAFPVFYVTDILQITESLVCAGAGADPRLARTLDLIRSKQDLRLGSWSLEYDYAGKTWVDFGPKKQPNKWVTLRAVRVLAWHHPLPGDL